MKQLLRSFLDSQAILSDHDWNIFQSGLIERRFRKGSIILREGEIENYLSFIVSGTVRQYTLTSDGEDVSVGFASANCFASSYSSFISQKPSLLNVEALEDLFLLSINFEHLSHCYNVSATGERLGRLNAEMNLQLQEQRQISFLTKSATERYQELLEQNADLLRVVKLQHIASYLGIKPESLSRIRKSMNVQII